jgi:pheromone shutdown protein TraB
VLASTLEAPILLLGAAHVVDLAAPLRATLGARPLDAIALELDAERAQAVISGPGPGASPPPRRETPVLLRLWARIQRRLGTQLGAGAGAEMREAATVARERGLPLFLIDDPLTQTVGRLFRSMGMRERIQLLLGGFAGLAIPSRLVERQLDRYTEAPGDYLEEIRRSFPGVARVLLDERNEHMAERLDALRARGFGRIAVVVGDAHLPGLAAALKRRGVPVESVSLGELARGPAETSRGATAP